jgi:hypothetical protein
MYTVEKSNQTSDNRCLTHAELDEVSGGQGNLANACIRAATQWVLDHTYLPDQVNHDCRPPPNSRSSHTETKEQYHDHRSQHASP